MHPVKCCRSSVLRLPLVAAFISFWAITGLADVRQSSESATHISVYDSLAAIQAQVFEIKKELLLAEVQARSRGAGDAESVLSQTRAALVTIIVAFLAYMQEKRKNQGPSFSRWQVLLFAAILVLSMYATDVYFTDLQSRAGERVSEINVLLNRLPSMSLAELSSVGTFPSLESPGLGRKLRMLFCPNYAQCLAYFPVVIVLGFMLVRVLRLNK